MSKAQDPIPSTYNLAITLPGGACLHFAVLTFVRDIAQAISPRLAGQAVAGKVDGELVDLSYLIARDAMLQFITPRDDEGLVGHSIVQDAFLCGRPIAAGACN